MVRDIFFEAAGLWSWWRYYQQSMGMRGHGDRRELKSAQIRGQKIELATITVGVFFCFSAPGAIALDLSIKPQIQVGTRATDNLRSTIEEKESAWGFDTGGSAIVNVASDTWRSTVTPTVNFRRFAIGDDADADEYNVRTQSQWQFMERASGSLKFDYIRDSTLTTEQTDLGGRQNDIIFRDTFTVQPGLRYALTETTSLDAGFLFSDVGFENRPGASFSDYSYKQATLGGTHVLEEAVTLYLSMRISEFLSGPDDQKVTGATLVSTSAALTYGGQGGVLYQFSESLEADFSVGYNFTKSNFNSLVRFDAPAIFIDPTSGAPTLLLEQETRGSSTDAGLIASASLRKKLENLRAELNYSRSISPSSRGAQTVSDDIAVSLDRDLSRRWMTGLRGTYNLQTTQIEQNAANASVLNRDQVYIHAWVRYALTEKLSVNASYRFIWNEFSTPQRSVYNNGMFVTFTYLGQPYYYRGF